MDEFLTLNIVRYNILIVSNGRHSRDHIAVPLIQILNVPRAIYQTRRARSVLNYINYIYNTRLETLDKTSIVFFSFTLLPRREITRFKMILTS